jgi:WD40 repeat protein
VQLLKGHGYRKRVYDVAFAPDGRTLASCDNDNSIRLWDLTTGQSRQLPKAWWDFSPHLAFSPDGRALTWCEHNGVVVKDLVADTQSSLPVEIPGRVEWAWFTPDGRTILAAGDRLLRWDAATLRPVPDWPMPAVVRGQKALAPDGLTLAAAHSPYGTHQRSGGRVYDHQVQLVAAATGQVQGVLRGFNQWVEALAFAPDGQTLAAACGPTLWVRDAVTDHTWLRHKIDPMHFKAVAFTPDGRLLGAAHNDGTVRLYDTRSWHERACYNWKIGRATCLAFSPDCLRAAAGGGNGRIVVWDVDG